MSMVHSYQVVSAALQSKDSRWLQLEACREFQRGKCSRTANECKFAHPPPHVEVQTGKVTACFDSIKGRCNREKPPCKYFHPPQHLKEQLLINGRNNLAFKNALMQQLAAGALPMHGSAPMSSPSGALYAGVNQYYTVAASPPVGDSSAVMQMQLQHKLGNERLEGEPVYDGPVYYSPFPAVSVAYKRSDKGGSVPCYMAPAAAVAAYQQAMLHQQQQTYLQQYAGPPPAVPRYSSY